MVSTSEHKEGNAGIDEVLGLSHPRNPGRRCGFWSIPAMGEGAGHRCIDMVETDRQLFYAWPFCAWTFALVWGTGYLINRCHSHRAISKQYGSKIKKQIDPLKCAFVISFVFSTTTDPHLLSRHSTSHSDPAIYISAFYNPLLT
jgi:hypothetical protein